MLGLDLNERVSVGVYDLTKKVATLESNTAFMSQHLLAAEAKAEEARLLIVANAARIEFLKGIFVEAREDASVPYWLQVKIAEALK